MSQSFQNLDFFQSSHLMLLFHMFEGDFLKDVGEAVLEALDPEDGAVGASAQLGEDLEVLHRLHLQTTINQQQPYRQRPYLS